MAIALFRSFGFRSIGRDHWHIMPTYDTIVTIGETAMPTRNVVLTDRQEALIEALVQSGRYQNASEVMREGLRLVENREVEEATKLETLRDAAQLGISALDRGAFKEFADASALVAHLDALADNILSSTEGN
jgi:antitoxin ParD1/3/4